MWPGGSSCPDSTGQCWLPLDNAERLKSRTGAPIWQRPSGNADKVKTEANNDKIGE